MTSSKKPGATRDPKIWESRSLVQQHQAVDNNLCLCANLLINYHHRFVSYLAYSNIQHHCMLGKIWLSTMKKILICFHWSDCFYWICSRVDVYEITSYKFFIELRSTGFWPVKKSKLKSKNRFSFISDRYQGSYPNYVTQLEGRECPQYFDASSASLS